MPGAVGRPRPLRKSTLQTVRTAGADTGNDRFERRVHHATLSTLNPFLSQDGHAILMDSREGPAFMEPSCTAVICFHVMKHSFSIKLSQELVKILDDVKLCIIQIPNLLLCISLLEL